MSPVVTCASDRPAVRRRSLCPFLGFDYVAKCVTHQVTGVLQEDVVRATDGRDRCTARGGGGAGASEPSPHTCVLPGRSPSPVPLGVCGGFRPQAGLGDSLAICHRLNLQPLPEGGGGEGVGPKATSHLAKDNSVTLLLRESHGCEELCAGEETKPTRVSSRKAQCHTDKEG